MTASKSFGRRAASPPRVSEGLPAVRKIRTPGVVVERRESDSLPPAPIADASLRAASGGPATVEQELEEWNAARRVRKRSFREPWRSVSIVAGLGFVATSWILPDSVADVSQIALGVLSAGSFFAGWRVRKAI